MLVKGCDWVRECNRAKGNKPAELGEKRPMEMLEGLIGFDSVRVRPVCWQVQGALTSLKGTVHPMRLFAAVATYQRQN
jgi:hypothetical protein